MRFNLQDEVKKELLVAAHRGSAGGLIPCNTLAAFDAAIYDGADMVELDVTRAKDGELFVFHPHLEGAHLDSPIEIPALCANQVKRLRYVTRDRVPTPYGVNTLDEALEHLKGKCYINVDNFWQDMEGIANAIRRHGIQEQVIIKTYVGDETFHNVEKYAPDLAYMVMMKETDVDTEKLCGMNLNFIGAEVMFSNEESPLAQKTYIDWMHARGLIVWCNAIVFNMDVVFGAGHSDIRSMMGDPDGGWGWMADRGYDIMQTDWAGSAVRYLKDSGKKYRRR